MEFCTLFDNMLKLCVCSCLFSTSSVYLSSLPEEKMKSLLPREIVESRLQIAILDKRVYVVFLSKVHSIVPKLPSPCQPSSFYHFSMDCKWQKLRESACRLLYVVCSTFSDSYSHSSQGSLSYRLYLTKSKARLQSCYHAKCTLDDSVGQCGSKATTYYVHTCSNMLHLSHYVTSCVYVVTYIHGTL